MSTRIQIIFLSFFLNIINAYGIEKNIFSNNYPSASNFQLTLFSKVKDYLDALSSQSIITNNANGLTAYQFKKLNSLKLELVFIKIERMETVDSLTERVQYSFENGQIFSYELIKYGANNELSSDIDLRMMRLKTTQLTNGYEVRIPQLGLVINSRISETSTFEKISLNEIGFELSIETFYQEKMAQRNYIYFFNGMPNPQTSLSVRVDSLESNWAKYKFTHFGSSLGEVSPSVFYQGLTQGSALFDQLSFVFLLNFESLGFPKLQ